MLKCYAILPSSYCLFTLLGFSFSVTLRKVSHHFSYSWIDLEFLQLLRHFQTPCIVLLVMHSASRTMVSIEGGTAREADISALPNSSSGFMLDRLLIRKKMNFFFHKTINSESRQLVLMSLTWVKARAKQSNTNFNMESSFDKMNNQKHILLIS